MAAFTPAGIQYVVQGFSSGLSNLDQLNKAQQGLGTSASGSAGLVAGLGTSIATVGAAAAAAAVAGIAALVAGIAAIGTASTTTAISFESAFAGVLKTTKGLTDETGNLNQAGQELRQEFVELSKEIPVSFEELSKIGELGGQLGIGTEDLIGFTDTIAKLGVSTNLAAEDAGAALARLAIVFKDEVEASGLSASENIEALGNAIVALGNTFPVTESEIVQFGRNMAGVGSIVGLTQADVLAIGTALGSAGINAEAGGTAIQKVLLEMQNAVSGASTGFVDNTKAITQNVQELTSLNAELVTLEAQTGITGQGLLQQQQEFIAAGGAAEDFGRQLGDTRRKRLFETAQSLQELTAATQTLRQEQGKAIPVGQLNKFAKVAGLTGEEFKQLFEEDASQAFELFVAGLTEEGDNAAQVLDELGLADQRLIRSFLGLAGAGDLLSNAIATSNEAFVNGTDLQDEAAARFRTTESQLQLLKNTFRATGDILGSSFLPIINELATGAMQRLEFLEPVFQGIAASISEMFNAFQVGGFAGLAQALNIPPEVLTTISSVTEEMQRLFDIFQEQGTEGLLQDFFGTSDLTTIFQGFVNDLISSIPAVLTTVLDAINNFLSANWPTIAEELTKWGNQFWDFIQNTVVPQASEKLIAIGDAIALWATSAETQQKLAELGQQLGVMFLDGMAIILENPEKIIEIVNQVILGFTIAVAAITGTIIALGATLVTNFLLGIFNKLTGGDTKAWTVSQLLEFIEFFKAVDWFGIGAALMEDFLRGVDSQVAKVRQVFGGIIDNIKTILFEVDWLQIGLQMMADFALGILQNTQDIIRAFEELVEEITGPLLIFDWVNIGLNIMEGILQGLKDNEAKVIDFLKDLLKEIWEVFTSGLSLGSPSKRAALMAKLTLQGFEVGLEKQAPKTLEKFKDFGEGMVKALTRGVSVSSRKFQDTFLDDLNINDITDEMLGFGGRVSNNLKNIIEPRLLGVSRGLEAGTFAARDFGRSANEIAAQWNVPIQMMDDMVDGLDLVEDGFERLDAVFNKVELEFRLDNIASAIGRASQFANLALKAAQRLLSGIDVEIAAIEDVIISIDDLMAQTQTALSFTGIQESLFGMFADENLTQLESDIEGLNAAIAQQQEEGTAFVEFGGELLSRIAAQKLLNELTEEKNKLDQQQLNIQKDIQKLQFIQTQLDLLKLAKEEGLDIAEIFGGIEFGLDASLPDLLAATDAIVQGLTQSLDQSVETFAAAEGIVTDLGDEVIALGDIFAADEQVEAQKTLNELLEEQAEIQQKLLEIQQKQADLAFLQQQIALLQLVRDAGLDITEVFGDIEFGLDTSLDDLLEVTANVVDAMIAQIEEDLEIGSPSRVLQRLATEAIEGFALGISNAKSMVLDALDTVPLLSRQDRAMAVPSTTSSSSTVNNDNRNISFPMTIENGMSPAQAEEMITRVVFEALGA